MKFEQLLFTARQIGAERIATGHYARVRHNPETDRYELLRAVDDSKDQSYFLFGLTQEQLARADFPLGEMTKQEVRAIARRLAVPVAEKPESQEICFVPSGSYVRFIESYLKEQGTAPWLAERTTEARASRATLSRLQAKFSAVTMVCTIIPSASAAASVWPKATRCTSLRSTARPIG